MKMDKNALSDGKRLCSICEDVATGKHYGVFSCEGCKGFFKRTVRTNLQYTCKGTQNCPVNRQERNRCQYCRYQKCVISGMKKEAVQTERPRKSRKTEPGQVASDQPCPSPATAVIQDNIQSDVVSPFDGDSNFRMDCGVDSQPIGYSGNCAEKIDKIETILNNEVSTQAFYLPEREYLPNFIQGAIEKQSQMVATWLRMMHKFFQLPQLDLVNLVKRAWNELLLADICFRSLQVNGALMLSNGLIIRPEDAHLFGLEQVFNRVLLDLVNKMRSLNIDQTELGCLKILILLNGQQREAQCNDVLENLREEVFLTLEQHTRVKYPEMRNRFSRVMLRLPPFRSIALKCTHYLLMPTPHQNLDVEVVINNIYNQVN